MWLHLLELPVFFNTVLLYHVALTTSSCSFIDLQSSVNEAKNTDSSYY